MTPDPKMAALAQLLLSSGRLQESMDCHDAAGELAALRARLAEAEAELLSTRSMFRHADGRAEKEKALALAAEAKRYDLELANGYLQSSRDSNAKLADRFREERDAAIKTKKKIEENWRQAYEEDTAVLNRDRQELHLHRYMAEGNYWAWQGDGHDYPESLTCPVLMSAEQVRALLASRDALAAELTKAHLALEPFVGVYDVFLAAKGRAFCKHWECVPLNQFWDAKKNPFQMPTLQDCQKAKAAVEGEPQR